MRTISIDTFQEILSCRCLSAELERTNRFDGIVWLGLVGKYD